MTDLARRLVKQGTFGDLAEQRRLNEANNWEQAMRIARLHAEVFNTEAGEKLLEYWVRIFVARPIVRPHEDVRSDGIREGQADVVRQILAQLEVARTGPGGEPQT